MSQVMEYQMFINGQWTPGRTGELMEVINPSTQEVVATVPRASRDDVDDAIGFARETFESGVWSNKSMEERAAVLMNAAILAIANKDRMAWLESLTSGATMRRTISVDAAEVSATLLLTGMIAKELPIVEHSFFSPPWVAPMHTFWKREPIGVCAGITPWNFP